mgnify:FL=1
MVEEIGDLRMHSDGNFFHDIMEKMLLALDFSFLEAWYEMHTFLGPIQVTSIEELERVKASDYSRRRRKYMREKDFVVVTTHYKGFDALKEERIIARTIMSNSTFGMDRPILSASSLSQIKGAVDIVTERDPLALAFERNYIVEDKGLYFLHPRYIYELVKRNLKG